jgi:hypothetical protein
MMFKLSIERFLRLDYLLFQLLLLLSILALLFGVAPARAGNTVFLTDRNGQITFPLSPPNRATSGPGLIDNMDIGNTTPKAGSFTTLKTTDGLVCASYYFTGTPAATDQVFFVATRPYIVVSVSEVHAVAAGGASVLQVTKDTSTNAPGAGTDLLTNNTNTGFDLNGTANTPQVGTLVVAATRTLAVGDRLAVDYANAIQSSAGVVVTACMAPQ